MGARASWGGAAARARARARHHHRRHQWRAAICRRRRRKKGAKKFPSRGATVQRQQQYEPRTFSRLSPPATRSAQHPSPAEERPPSGRAQWYLPTLARRLPAPRPYLPTLAQVFPIAAVTYLPGQRDATLTASHRRWCRRWRRLARARARAAAPPHDTRAPTGASAFNTRRALAARAP